MCERNSFVQIYQTPADAETPMTALILVVNGACRVTLTGQFDLDSAAAEMAAVLRQLRQFEWDTLVLDCRELQPTSLSFGTDFVADLTQLLCLYNEKRGRSLAILLASEEKIRVVDTVRATGVFGRYLKIAPPRIVAEAATL